MSKERSIKQPSFMASLILSVVVIGILLVSVIVFDMDIQLALFMCIIVASSYAIYLGFKWNDIEKMMLDGISSIIIASLILLLIGIVISTWIASGTIPYIIYAGLKLISPQFFLISACLTCAFMSMATGSSWSSAGTVGIAFMGIGAGLGINPAMTAGAVVSGSFFGDKQSPFSNTTNLAAALSKTTLFEHTSSMLWTTTPALVVSLIIYGILGFTGAGTSGIGASEVDLYLSTLESTFNLTPLLLIPIGVLIIVMIKKSPPIPGLIISSFIGVVFAMIFQAESFANIGVYMFDGFAIETGVAQIDRLLNGGGLYSMLWTLSFYFMACILGEILDGTGVLAQLLGRLASITRKPSSLITGTIVSGILLNIFTGAIESAFLITGKLFAPAYDDLGIDRKVLSRALEDGGTVPAPLIPWNSNGMYMAATLGVGTLAYAPYAFVCFMTPIVGILFANMGIATFMAKDKPKNKKNSTEQI